MTASIPGDTREDDRAPSTEPARGSRDLEKPDSPNSFEIDGLFSESISSDEHLAKRPSKSKGKKQMKQKKKKEKNKDGKVKKKKKETKTDKK